MPLAKDTTSEVTTFSIPFSKSSEIFALGIALRSANCKADDDYLAMSNNRKKFCCSSNQLVDFLIKNKDYSG